jgi:uncharacterized protein YndB with AHSA1/START domain
MRQLRTHVEINAPAERVWRIMFDVERWHEWTPSIRSITLLDPGPLAPGTRARIRQPKFPPVVWRVTEVDPGRSFSWESRSPGMTVTGRHSVEPAGAGSRATLELQYEGLFGGLFAALTRNISERYVGLEAAGLKRRSESPID